MASRIENLLDRQQADFDGLGDAEARRMLRALDDARRELAETIRGMESSGADQKTPWTAQQRRVMLAQIEAAEIRLRARLGEVLDETVRKAREAAQEDLLAVIKANEPEFKDTGGRLEEQVIRNLDDPERLLLARHSVKRYSADLIGEMQRQLVSGMLQGETIRQITQRLAGIEGSVIAGKRARAELIVRMELNSAYNEHHLQGLKDAAAFLDEPGRLDPLMKQAVEFLDQRSHPISWALNGRVVGPDEPFKVPIAEVQAWAARLKKSGSGVVWPKVGGDYVGVNYPAHFWERGRISGWRSSWGESRAMPAPLGAARKGPPINRGHHEKHVLGPKYDKLRSILSADPEYLAQWAGKGVSANGIPLGKPGCSERVDFGFVIGNFHEVDLSKKKVLSRQPTTVGIIKYSKKGIHIVPARPAIE